MNKLQLLCILLVLGYASNASEINKPVSSPHGFIENKGQIIDQNNKPNDAVKYLFHFNGLNVQLRANGFSYDTYTIEKKTTSKPQSVNTLPDKFKMQDEEIIYHFHRIDIEFIGANAHPELVTENPSFEYTNYYTTGNPEQGVINVKTYQKVTYKNLYEGIDLEFNLSSDPSPKERGVASRIGSSSPSGRLRGIKYNFIIHPGADISQIKWKYNGALNTTLSEEKIILQVAQGNLQERIPQSFILEGSQPVIVNYVLLGKGEFGFSNATYNKNSTLVIDPTPFATYFGGSGADYGQGTATDASGNVFVTGYTNSSSNIATSGTYQTTFAGVSDVFISKFNSTGSLQWATYYGGSGNDYGYGIANDANGNICITGNTNSTTGIATSGSYQTVFGGYYDAFIAKFNTSGSLQWGTCFGGDGYDCAYGIAIDKNNGICITGYTNSLAGISTTGAHQSISKIDTFNLTGDAFVAKFSSGGSRQWATYYGGVRDEYGFGIAIDVNGNVCVTGTTKSGTDIATTGAYQSSFFQALRGTTYCLYSANFPDAFIVKFDSSGIRQWGTYYFDVSYGYGIVTDTSGNVFVTGKIGSADSVGQVWNGIIAVSCFSAQYRSQATTGSYQTVYGGGNSDAFIIKFDSSGIRQWASFYGGSSGDVATGITADLSGNIIITGYTNSTSGISSIGCYQPLYAGGGSDAFVVKLNSSGYRLWATYYGGDSIDCGNAIASDGAGNINITGYTYSSTGISTLGTYQTTNAGDNDAFVASYTDNGRLYPPVLNNTISGVQVICPGTTPSGLTGSMPTGGSGIYFFKWRKSVISPDSGFINAGGNDSSQNYTPSIVTSNTWYKRIVYSGNKDTSAAIAITMKLRPGFTINNINQCLNGNNFSFNDTSTFIGGSITRKWNFGTGALDTSSIISPSKIYATKGVYSVKLITTGTNGCVDSISKTIYVIKPIAGFFLNKTAQCINGNIFAFYDTSSVISGQLTRLWNFGNGSGDTANTINPAKVYASSGSFAIKLLSISNFGCKDSLTKTVTVYPKPNPGFTVNDTNQCLNGNSFQFNDTSNIGSGTLTRKWNFGAGTSDTSSSLNPNKIYTISNTYLIKLVSTSDNSCKDSITKPVSVNPKSNIGFIVNNSSQCISENNFIFNDTSSFSHQRLWNFGNGDTSSISNVSKTYITATTYSVKLISTNIYGCMDTATKTVDVNPKPSVGFTINNPSQCETGNNFLFNDTTVITNGTTSRKWNFGIGNADTSSSVGPSKVYPGVNTYSVKLISTSDKGCKDSLTKSVTVNPKPLVGFTSNNWAQCLNGNNFILSDTSWINSGTLTRIWSFGNGDTSTMLNPSKSYNAVNTYLIKLVSLSDKGCKDSMTKSVVVYAKLNVGFTQNAISLCLIGNIFSFDDTTLNVNTRLWNLGDLTINTNDTFSKTYSSAGQYNVKLKITDTNNCSDSISKVVTVKPNPAKPVITAFSNSQLQSTVAGSYQWYLNNNVLSGSTSQTLSLVTNGTYTVKIDSTNGCGNISDPFIATKVGINEIFSSNEIKIYPNPATNEITVHVLINLKGHDVEIYDLHGRKLISEKINSDSFNINISTLDAGMYFLIIDNKVVKFVHCTQ